SLKLAVEYKCESIAFPLISSGIYGYPKADALRVATDAITDFIGEHDINVALVVFDKAATLVNEGLLGAVESYIDEHYVDKLSVSRLHLLDFEGSAPSTQFNEILNIPKQVREKASPKVFAAQSIGQSLDDLVGNLDEPFSTTLLRLIDSTGRTDAEVYRRANIDRRLFSKIRSNENYAPSKSTVLAFAIALELTLDQTDDLLERAGFALSNSRKFDVIVEFFIQSRNFDIFEINQVLFSYDQPLLGEHL
ncbi:MAG: macro domain-containing protein, partial [Oscillospiraceae bacterium]|nr:macro domain-containing protein [Oscillospiraceae bacterium]